MDQSPDLASDLHSPQRRLIELRMAHADLDALIDRAESPGASGLAAVSGGDELALRRLKKRRLALRDQMARLERSLTPKEPA